MYGYGWEDVGGGVARYASYQITLQQRSVDPVL
jgi:hypothetical protein